MNITDADPAVISQTLVSTRVTIYAQIDAERSRQNRQWGGDWHDNGHQRRTWKRIIGEHVERLAKLARGKSAMSKGDAWRNRLVVIAALCVAAIEAHDRKKALA